MNRRVSSVSILLLATWVSGCSEASESTSPEPVSMSPDTKSSGTTTAVEMKNVVFRIEEGVDLEIRHLQGGLVPTSPPQPATFDHPESFQLEVASAEIAILTAGLTELMNRHVFPESDAPIQKLEISVDDSQLELKGVLHSAGIPFEIEGTLEPTADGRLRLRPDAIKTFLDIPVKGLMDLFDVELADLINTREAKGIRVESNEITLDPSRLVPPPRILGRITEVRFEGQKIVQIFRDESKEPRQVLKPARPDEANYMYFQGGILRFGKLTMHDSDLQIIDEDPKDAFNFFLKRYNEQLIAGYSKNEPDFGLVLYAPDFEDLGKTSSAEPKANREETRH